MKKLVPQEPEKTRNLNIRNVPLDMYLKLKIRAAEQEVPVRHVVLRALRALFE